jgi:hypothetical protein
VAWPTKSGDGYRLQLDYIPTSAGSEIYALPWEEKAEEAESAPVWREAEKTTS